MYKLAERLFPICRSITGNGVRQTLKILQDHIPLVIHEVPSGTKVFDWTVPKEWNIKDAYVADEKGKRIIDFKKNNLHVVGYSTPVNKTVTLSELDEHSYSDERLPNAIPYVTSYYAERWGFCMTHNERQKLKERKYKVVIDSELKDGSLTYGELIIPGKSKKEIFLSTYVCHPSMANNEISGPVVTTFLAKWLLSEPREYTYRIVFIPETIGSITYLSKNLKQMKQNIIAGFNVTCVGDDRCYSYLPSRLGNTLADKVALKVLKLRQPKFISYSFLDRGSDERQYCSVGVDLPVATIMRSKYGTYPEYHTSLDNLELISPEGLAGSYKILQECLSILEREEFIATKSDQKTSLRKNGRYKMTCLGEPQLGKRGLYPTISAKGSADQVRNMMNFIAYADGDHDVKDISQKIKVPAKDIDLIAQKLLKAKLVEVV